MEAGRTGWLQVAVRATEQGQKCGVQRDIWIGTVGGHETFERQVRGRPVTTACKTIQVPNLQ